MVSFSEALDLVVGFNWCFGTSRARILQKQGRPRNRIAKSIDSDQIFSLLGELRQLLEEDDFRAIRSLETLRRAIPAGMAENELTDLEKHIEGYAFEKALETLSVVEQTLNHKLK